ncbi:MAG: hypothetical protein KatS3mg105_4432 [Gemmatales bacterium]|nr:MAG: hypothetical protein KatS3mg105_4432 [Gemmatales bacterium]
MKSVFYIVGGLGRLYGFQFPGKPAPRIYATSIDYSTQPLPQKPEEGYSPYDRARGYGGKVFESIGPLHDLMEPRKEAPPKPKPTLIWDYRANARLDRPPIVTADNLVIADSGGRFFITSKTETRVNAQFETDAPLSAPLAQYRSLVTPEGPNKKMVIEEMVYVASRDYHLYALNVTRGEIVWRFTGGAPILQQPVVNDWEIYVVTEGAGLYRIDRKNGDILWRNREAQRFLSANKKFVYAADVQNNLLILSRESGAIRARYDVRDFNVPVVNEATDRFFLAAHNGLLVCLHDREYSTPLIMKTPLAEPKPKKTRRNAATSEKNPNKQRTLLHSFAVIMSFAS